MYRTWLKFPNGEKYEGYDIVWIEVQPVKWLIDEKAKITIVLIAVAKLESVFFIPIFARIVVKDVNGNDVVLTYGSGGHAWSIKSVDGDFITIVKTYYNEKLYYNGYS